MKTRLWHSDSPYGYVRPYVTPGSQLLPREIEIVKMRAEGFSNHEIAKDLGISYSTVRNHQANARVRLGARNSVEMVMAAIGNRYFSSFDVMPELD